MSGLLPVYLALFVVLTVAVGLVGSRDLMRRPPLPVLREAPE